jgi:hypothetical protein
VEPATRPAGRLSTMRGGSVSPPREDPRRTAFLAKIDHAFAGRKFDIEQEINLPEGQVYETEFGHRGRHGWILKDRVSGERKVLGWTVLKLIHDRHGSVELPKKPRPQVKIIDRE